jgi:hypothetical protein
VTGESYLELLSQWLIPEHDNVGLLYRVILQQDWVLAHYAADVHAFLNNQFPLWTGQHGSLILPPSLPDHMQQLIVVFFKEQLSIICMHTVAELKGKIHCIFNTITTVMLQWASQCTWQQMQLCVDNDGKHTDWLDG